MGLCVGCGVGNGCEYIEKKGQEIVTLGKRDILQSLLSLQYAIAKRKYFALFWNFGILIAILLILSNMILVWHILQFYCIYCNLIVPKPDGMLPLCLQQTSTRKTSRYVPSDCVLDRVWDSAVNQ